MKKILIFGSNGMLGSYISVYLKTKGYNVYDFNRQDLDISQSDNLLKDLKKLLFDYKISSNDIIINCAGMIKQRNDEKINFIKVNSLFPLYLATLSRYDLHKTIHVTTDCVYDGKVGGYDENSKHSATDVYGISKSLGESDRITTIRTSIIGEERFNKKSLIEWVKSQKNQSVNGFTNHIWNGITCLKFAEICEQIISTNQFWMGVKHIFSPNLVTKNELVQIISDVYDLKINVNPFEAPEKIDRSLKTIRNSINFQIEDIRDQIIKQKNFGAKYGYN